jgi:hypothetical protein
MSNTQWLMELLRAHFWRKQKRAFFSLLPSRPPINKGSSSEGHSLGMAMAIKDLSSQTPAHQSPPPTLQQLLDTTLVPQFSCPILQPTTPLRKAKNRPQIRAHSRHSWSNHHMGQKVPRRRTANQTLGSFPCRPLPFRKANPEPSGPFLASSNEQVQRFPISAPSPQSFYPKFFYQPQSTLPQTAPILLPTTTLRKAKNRPQFVPMRDIRGPIPQKREAVSSLPSQLVHFPQLTPAPAPPLPP